jgi:hypothetical protein
MGSRFIIVPFRQACKIFDGGAAMTGRAENQRPAVGAAAAVASVCR